jgi:hypothetical protein
MRSCIQVCFYSVAVDDNTDTMDVVQMAVFIRAADDTLVTEELAAVLPIKGTTKDTDLLTALK